MDAPLCNSSFCRVLIRAICLQTAAMLVLYDAVHHRDRDRSTRKYNPCSYERRNTLFRVAKMAAGQCRQISRRSLYRCERCVTQSLAPEPTKRESFKKSTNKPSMQSAPNLVSGASASTNSLADSQLSPSYDGQNTVSPRHAVSHSLTHRVSLNR